jgi:LPS O-antigen subunit length determinant protein (WzzB/FepE family)
VSVGDWVRCILWAALKITVEICAVVFIVALGVIFLAMRYWTKRNNGER